MNSLVLLAAIASSPAQYQFKTDQPTNYSMSVVFEGFIPILGGQEGKAEARLKFLVKGLDSKKENESSAFSELTEAEILFNDAKLPLGLDNIKDFFPKTTITFTKFGKTLTTDAPDRNLPIKLPGLDAKRFPDISYLPIEFPNFGTETGKTFKFEKNFGDSPVFYECTMGNTVNGLARFDLIVKQKYSNMENASIEITTAKEDAEYMVDTEVLGKGFVIFDLVKGQVQSMNLDAVATSNVTEIISKKKSVRTMKTVLRVVRVEPK